MDKQKKIVYSKRKRKLIGRARLAVCILLLLVLVAAGIWYFTQKQAKEYPQESGSESHIIDTVTDQADDQTAEDPNAQTEEEAEAAAAQQLQDDPAAQIAAAARANATKDQPQIAEFADWNENAKQILTELCNDSYYAAYGFSIDKQEGYPYLLAVNRAASTVTVYTLDENGQYTVPFMAMVCSGGNDTPLGYWSTPVSYDWRLLAGPCYGQYATRIWDSYLFHSVPYYSQHQDDLEYDQFNQLGSLASLGCIRLAVVDVKWIYDNCPIGTPVIIYDDAASPGPMGKPGTIYTDPTDYELRGWDPTDPNPENPWPQSYRTGTAIRSLAALQQWEDMSETWQDSINAASLQGFSTDSGVEGTRG